jgi:hypothetical protein
MLSSTSSSDGKAWLATWAAALLVAALALFVAERHWRAQGYVPTVLDSTQLWSIQRGRVYGDSPRPLVLLGASRIEYGVDMKTLRDELPHYKPVMLAVNGLYPLSVLRDLAQDPDFRGVVLCDVESNTFISDYFFVQQAYPDYYHQRWTPSWHLHRVLLTAWQRAALIANPEYGVLASLKRGFGGGVPFRNYVNYYSNRSGDIDYTKTDPEATKKHFADTVEGNIARLPKRDPDTWLADIAPVYDWVRAIQARGGTVIFYESPTLGLTRDINDRLYPREQYWNRFVAASPAPVVSANAVPALANTPLPDDSHIDYRNKAAYTRKLVDALVERGLLTR